MTAPKVEPTPQAPALTFTANQAQALLTMFGGEPGEVTVVKREAGECAADEETGAPSLAGLYAHMTEYPGEGCCYLGDADEEATPQAPAVAVLADAINALDASLDENVPYERTPVYEAMAAVKQAYLALATPQPPTQPQAQGDAPREAPVRTSVACALVNLRLAEELARSFDEHGMLHHGIETAIWSLEHAESLLAALSAPPPAQAAEAVAWWKPGTNLVVHNDLKADTNNGHEFSVALYASPSPAASAEGKKSSAPSVRSRDEG
jgi:hypothetical protein